MTVRDIRADARLLGGEASGTSILCPGPGHSKPDRSLSLRRAAKSPIGYLVHSFAGDDVLDCLDHVRHRLGLPEFEPGAYKPPSDPEPDPEEADPSANSEFARFLWQEARPIIGTLAEKYLFASRGLRLDSGLDWSKVLRFHPGLSLEGKKVPGMIALMRDIETKKPRAIQRTFLSREGFKITRRMLGPAKGCAIMIDQPNEPSLAIGEGLESTLSGRVFGYAPAWATGSAGAIASFPALSGIEQLFIFAENDTGANGKAILECGERWRMAGKRVTEIRPTPPHGDLNDELLALPSLPLDERANSFLGICAQHWPGAELAPEDERVCQDKRVKDDEQSRLFPIIKKLGLAAFDAGSDECQ